MKEFENISDTEPEEAEIQALVYRHEIVPNESNEVDYHFRMLYQNLLLNNLSAGQVGMVWFNLTITKREISSQKIIFSNT